jgi:hypothetical protein
MLPSLEAPPLADAPIPHVRPWCLLPLRSVRPSLLDPRFTGDPWIVDHRDGTASVCLADYRLTGMNALSLDLPSLNRVFGQLRQRQMSVRRRARRATRHVSVARAV